MIPGELFPAPGDVVLNADQPTCEVTVRNRGDRPIQVGSHCHFCEVNRALAFDRAAAYGYRLDVPAGTSVRFEPGEERTVRLVALAGRRIARGISGLVEGELDRPEVRAMALLHLELESELGLANDPTPNLSPGRGEDVSFWGSEAPPDPQARTERPWESESAGG